MSIPPHPPKNTVFIAEHDLKLSDVRIYMGKILFSFLSSFLLTCITLMFEKKKLIQLSKRKGNV